jgi:ATP-dependent DNA helicase 2 subunit 1
MEAANEQYLSHLNEDDDDAPAIQPEILSETFPPCEKDKELNVAEVLVTCNFIFRDA